MHRRTAHSTGALTVGVALALALALALAGTGLSWAAPKEISPVDINKATADELQAVPGIGKVMAQRIVDFRNENGPFRRLEDLMRVKGIGEKSFQRLRPYLKMSDPS